MLSVGKVVVFEQVRCNFWQKNMTVLVKKKCREKKLSKSVFGYFKTNNNFAASLRVSDLEL